MSETVSDTVYWINGRCYTCGSTTARVNVRQAWCKGCGREIGTIGWEDDTPAAQKQSDDV